MPLIPSEQELRDMVKEGKTLYQISRKFDMVIKEVFKLGRSYGIYFDYYHNHIPKPTKQDLESMYHDEHLTQYQISREFNVAESTVQWWLRNYNIQCTVPIPPKEVLERIMLLIRLLVYGSANTESQSEEEEFQYLQKKFLKECTSKKA